MKTAETAIADYVAALEAMRPDTIDTVLDLCAETVRFTDPFNDVTGRAALRHVFEDMFDKVSELTFTVDDCQGSDRTWLLRWTYAGRMGALGHTRIEGMSHVVLDEDNRVCRHADYWDAGILYEKIPLIGRVIRGIRRRISASRHPRHGGTGSSPRQA
ncbi:nuclear transport factor 2 family protein [Microbaculum marinisediminis]|uniref:Nuclear transport factor 2 family protein n=1 Tax=Microbaculum marinisediminis TaxID=2931392 RepID=A0AAW5R3Z5_9HYPH|nr:nuclear transport factor 2 family protein [Microbaculum sp. A6E488]MCT8973324.1 nuclear transport factor 2 family protein [Microbaculum sp. A6E488]